MAASDFKPIFPLFLFLLLLPIAYSDDPKCLERIKSALGDPQGKLTSWVFTNTTPGFICQFQGVECWNETENRILQLNLPNAGLTGEIPDSFQYCSTYVLYINISGNSFSGSVPAKICKWLPFLVSIDFSTNQLSGEIPPDLAGCEFLNGLDLSRNRLSGSIPFQLSSLQRLRNFSVADNDLQGYIPSGLDRFDKSDFEGNKGLCGKPLEKCGRLSKKSLAIIIGAGVLGAIASSLIGLVWIWRHW